MKFSLPVNLICKRACSRFALGYLLNASGLAGISFTDLMSKIWNVSTVSGVAKKNLDGEKNSYSICKSICRIDHNSVNLFMLWFAITEEIWYFMSQRLSHHLFLVWWLAQRYFIGLKADTKIHTYILLVKKKVEGWYSVSFVQPYSCWFINRVKDGFLVQKCILNQKFSLFELCQEICTITLVA